MSVIRITKCFQFEMAHALLGYDGLCRHIHGHSYELMVTIMGTPINDPLSPHNGMLMDFGQLKNIVKLAVIDDFDHALMIHQNAKEEVLKSRHEMFARVVWVPYQPTIENMLKDIVNRIKPSLPDRIRLQHLLLRETVTSFAEWYAEDNVH